MQKWPSTASIVRGHEGDGSRSISLDLKERSLLVVGTAAQVCVQRCWIWSRVMSRKSASGVACRLYAEMESEIIKLPLSLAVFKIKRFSIIFSTFAFHFKLSTFSQKFLKLAIRLEMKFFELSMQCSCEKKGKRDINKTFALGFSIFFFTFAFYFSLSKIVSLFT